MAVHFSPNLQLPWSSSGESNERFVRILSVLFAIFLVLTVVIVLVDVPEIPREEKERLPPQLARIVLEKQELPPPIPVEPPKVEEKKPEEKTPEEKPEEKPVEKLPEEKKPEPKPVEKRPEPIKTVEQARETAKVSGLLQFQDELMDMRDIVDTSTLASANLAQGDAQAAQVDRSAVTSGVTGTSGGINNAALSRDTGGVALSGRETTQVTSELATATRKAAETGNGEGGKSRGEEEMSKVMDQHKGAIFQIYNRALRQNAALQGRVVMNIIIEPSGKITDVVIVTSELKDPELEAALIRRIRMITFPASAVVIRTTLRQTFDFLPQ